MIVSPDIEARIHFLAAAQKASLRIELSDDLDEFDNLETNLAAALFESLRA